MFDRRRCLSAIKKPLEFVEECYYIAFYDYRKKIITLDTTAVFSQIQQVHLLQGSEDFSKLDGRKEMLRKRRQTDLQN